MEPPSLLSISSLLAVLLFAINAYFTLCVSTLSGLPQNKATDTSLDTTLSKLLASSQLGQSISSMLFAWLSLSTLFQVWVNTVPQPFSSILFILSIVLLALLYAGTRQSIKGFAESNAESLAKRLTKPLNLWHIVATVPTIALLALYRFGFSQLGVENKEPVSQSRKLRNLLAENLEDSHLNDDEKDMLKNVIDFSDLDAGDLMIPRAKVVWLSSDDDAETVLEKIKESGFTRFPYCKDNPDEVTGYIHVKDLGVLGQELQLDDLNTHVRPVGFMPESASATNLLRKLREEHIVVIVDEFGGMSGILTLEDLLEELVGDINDEFDEASLEIEELESGNLIVEGTVRLDELEREHNLNFGDVEEESIGGFVFGRLARQVNVGDKVNFAHGEIIVEKVDGLRVEEVWIRLKHNMTQTPHHDKQGTYTSETASETESKTVTESTETPETSSEANLASEADTTTNLQDKPDYPTAPQTLQ